MRERSDRDEDVCSRRRGLPRRLVLILSVLIVMGFHLASCRTVEAQGALEWREEVVLNDGGVVVVTGKVSSVPGEPFKTMPGARRLTFMHPTAGQQIVWDNTGKIGSRVNPRMLEFDAGRPFLVTTAQAATDYDEFGCPTPPYIVFRYDAGTWVRVPLAELPSRFVRMNLYPNPNPDRLKAQNYFITTSVTSARYKEAYPGDDEYRLRATVDRRIRNPLGLGCIRPERVYGAGSYKRMLSSGNWLDKTEDEALKLLWGNREGAKP